MISVNKVQVRDCLEGMGELPSESCDCCVTDPPYGIRFMGATWDYDIPDVGVWKEVLRVLKPGAHILVACGTRTQHRMAVNIEDAGFSIRDVICWHYGEGFPKSMNISLAIDRRFGVVGSSSSPESKYGGYSPVTEDAKRWDGWGTALKPATEFWTLARKPLAEATVADNMKRFGAGGINIDNCRIHGADPSGGRYVVKRLKSGVELKRSGGRWRRDAENAPLYHGVLKPGRFPANLILDEFMAQEMDKQSGILASGLPSGARRVGSNVYGKYKLDIPVTGYGDRGGASRFFYVAKASVSERGAGNFHPTVKPIELMQYLIRLICPIESGRVVLEPYAGSGSTCIAARHLGLDFYAFEKTAKYAEIAERRIRDAMGLFYGE